MDVAVTKYLKGLMVPDDFLASPLGLQYRPTGRYLIQLEKKGIFFNNYGISSYFNKPRSSRFLVCGVWVREGKIYSKELFLRLWT